MAYTDLSEHQWMIEDHVRTSSYEEALRRAVTPDDVVLDLGCGLGILGMFAARAGARKVYSVDRLPIVRLAQAIARKNGLTSIEFIHAPDGDFDLPEKVSVIVSEMMGHFAVHEGLLTPLCAARDRHLAPGGRMIPGRLVLKAGLALDPAGHQRRSYFQTRPYGLDFSPVAPWMFSELTAAHLTPDQVLGRAVVATLDMATLSGPPPAVEAELDPERACPVHGIAAWFEADLGCGVTFDCGPWSPRMHWGQLVFPFAEPLLVDPSRSVRIRLTPVRVDAVSTRWQWWAGDGAEERTGDDLTLLAYLRRPLPAGPLR